MRDVDEARAVDPSLRQPAPEVRRAEEAARLFHRISFAGAVELGLAHPARVVVGGANARPAVAPLLDANGLAAEELRDAFRLLARLRADCGDLDRTQHVHGGRV